MDKLETSSRDVPVEDWRDTMDNTVTLTFGELRAANVERLRSFPGHTNQWSPNDWMTAVAGEIGEAANLLKRIRRGVVVRGKEIPSVQEVGEELADSIIYLDLLAACIGIDLDAAIREKFNRVSREVEIPIYL